MEVSKNNRRAYRRGTHTVGDSETSKWEVVRTRRVDVGPVRTRRIKKVEIEIIIKIIQSYGNDYRRMKQIEKINQIFFRRRVETKIEVTIICYDRMLYNVTV